LTALEGFEAGLCRQRAIFDLSNIAEHSGRNSLAEIDVETPPNA
jgi:hypothetical protein